MGTIYKRGKIYYVDYRLDGKRIRKKIGRSKQIAELALKDVEVKIAKNEIGIIHKDKTINELFDQYREYSDTNHLENTRQRYEEIIAHFQTFLKGRPHIKKLSQLGPSLFEEYKSYRRNTLDGENNNHNNGAKANTVNMEITILRSIFNRSIKWGYMAKNPTQDVKLLRVLDAKPARFLSKEECEKLLENCGERLYPIFLTFLCTGMRRGELLNLDWDDIDFKRKKILIRRKGDWRPRTGEREIPISGKLLSLLKELKEKQGKNSNYVFCDGNGKPFPKNKLRLYLMRLTKKLGFPDVTQLHSLRHTPLRDTW